MFLIKTTVQFALAIIPQRKEEDLKKKNDQMLKTIGQLTLERDFLQGCFRQAGAPLPDIPEYDPKG